MIGMNMNIDEILDNIYLLPQESKAALMCLLSEIEYPKGTRILQEKTRGTKIYFIKRGMVRSYARKGEKDVTFWFGKEGDSIFPLQTLFAGSTEYANVELLENTTLYILDMNELQKLYSQDIHIANWGRKYAESACIKSEKQFIERQFKPSAVRYRELLDEYPDITQRVSLGIIASYLGISQVSLSRIRARIRYLSDV